MRVVKFCWKFARWVSVGASATALTFLLWLVFNGGKDSGLAGVICLLATLGFWSLASYLEETEP